MRTDHRLAEALKNMMSEKPLDSISVLSLSKKCKVNRQTFYYYFHDIYDLLTLVFLDEKIEGIEKSKNFNEMVKCIFLYYDKNKKFIDAAINSGGKDLAFEFFYNACYQSALRYINEYPESKKLHANDKKAISRFYASAYSNSLLYYISNYKHKTLDGIITSFAFVNEDALINSINAFIQVRKKDDWFWFYKPH